MDNTSELSISYEEILMATEKFKVAERTVVDKMNSFENSLKDFEQNGLAMAGSEYESKIDNIRKSIRENANVIERDCNRINDYLTRVAQLAKDNMRQVIAASDAVSAFEATETVNK